MKYVFSALRVCSRSLILRVFIVQWAVLLVHVERKQSQKIQNARIIVKRIHAKEFRWDCKNPICGYGYSVRQMLPHEKTVPFRMSSVTPFEAWKKKSTEFSGWCETQWSTASELWIKTIQLPFSLLLFTLHSPLITFPIVMSATFATTTTTKKRNATLADGDIAALKRRWVLAVRIHVQCLGVLSLSHAKDKYKISMRYAHISIERKQKPTKKQTVRNGRSQSHFGLCVGEFAHRTDGEMGMEMGMMGTRGVWMV